VKAIRFYVLLNKHADRTIYHSPLKLFCPRKNKVNTNIHIIQLTTQTKFSMGKSKTELNDVKYVIHLHQISSYS